MNKLLWNSFTPLSSQVLHFTFFSIHSGKCDSWLPDVAVITPTLSTGVKGLMQSCVPVSISHSEIVLIPKMSFFPCSPNSFPSNLFVIEFHIRILYLYHSLLLPPHPPKHLPLLRFMVSYSLIILKVSMAFNFLSPLAQIVSKRPSFLKKDPGQRRQEGTDWMWFLLSLLLGRLKWKD